MKGLTTHILDLSRGLPAPNVPVRLEVQRESGAAGNWHLISEASTDADGRARLAVPTDFLPMGDYRLSFEVEIYFFSQQITAFYPLVQVIFRISEARHHHVPLLISPFGFSTYRGS